MTDKDNVGKQLSILPPDQEKPEESRFENSAMIGNDETDLALELPKRADSSIANAPSVAKQYVSEHMDMLTKAITEDNS